LDLTKGIGAIDRHDGGEIVFIEWMGINEQDKLLQMGEQNEGVIDTPKKSFSNVWLR